MKYDFLSDVERDYLKRYEVKDNGGRTDILHHLEVIDNIYEISKICSKYPYDTTLF